MLGCTLGGGTGRVVGSTLGSGLGAGGVGDVVSEVGFKARCRMCAIFAYALRRGEPNESGSVDGEGWLGFVRRYSMSVAVWRR